MPSPIKPATPSIPPLPVEPPPTTPLPPTSPPPSIVSTPALDHPSPAPAMANFPLDPMDFLPHGFDIIDRGELRLPRTFFAPAVAPDRQHEEYAIAIVEPAPLPEEIVIYRNMVSDFVVNTLG